MPSRDASVSSALAELNKGRVLESIEQFKEILRSDPANERACFYLSTLYTEMNEFEVAERYLRRAMDVNPRQGVHLHQLGLIRYRQKQWRAALAFFKQALEAGAGSNEAAVWRSIGDVHVGLFDRDAALQAYETALRIQPQTREHDSLSVVFISNAANPIGPSHTCVRRWRLIRCCAECIPSLAEPTVRSAICSRR